MNLRALPPHLMLALVCAGAATQAARAANWQSIGPYGGSVFRLARCAAEPAVVYALLAQGGVYRSGDGGRTWHDINHTLPAADYFDLAADPDDPGSAWVIDRSTQGPTSLYHTRDGGGLWRALTAPEGSLVVAAGRGGVVYAAGSGTFARSASWSDGSHGLAGLFAGPVGVRGPHSFLAGNQRTDDSGNRWTAFLTGRPVQDLAVDPAHPETVYAATGTGPDILWKSGDSGATWRPASTGLLSNSIVASLAIDPRHPRILYLATQDEDEGGGLFQSLGAAASWQRQPVAVLDPFFQVTVDTGDPACAYVATGLDLERSCDGGRTWAGLLGGGNLGIGFVSVAVAPSDPRWIYAAQVQLPDADSALLWRSKDGGQTLDASPLPCDPNAEVVLQVDPEAPDVVYAAVSLFGGGVFRRQGVAGAATAGNNLFGEGQGKHQHSGDHREKVLT